MAVSVVVEAADGEVVTGEHGDGSDSKTFLFFWQRMQRAQIPFSQLYGDAILRLFVRPTQAVVNGDSFPHFLALGHVTTLS